MRVPDFDLFISKAHGHSVLSSYEHRWKASLSPLSHSIPTRYSLLALLPTRLGDGLVALRRHRLLLLALAALRIVAKKVGRPPMILRGDAMTGAAARRFGTRFDAAHQLADPHAAIRGRDAIWWLRRVEQPIPRLPLPQLSCLHYEPAQHVRPHGIDRERAIRCWARSTRSTAAAKKLLPHAAVAEALSQPQFAALRVGLVIRAAVAPPERMAPLERRINVKRLLIALHSQLDAIVVKQKLKRVGAQAERLAACVPRVAYANKDKLIGLRPLDCRNNFQMIWITLMHPCEQRDRTVLPPLSKAAQSR